MQNYPQPNDHETVAMATANMPEKAKTAVPLDIVLSLLRQHELEKLRNYIASYLAKYDQQKIQAY